MAKYRKKPLIVEAVQFDGIPANDPPSVFRREDGAPYVVTVHRQQAYLEVGDWIIREPHDTYCYPCKPDIFAARYEPVDAPPAEAKPAPRVPLCISCAIAKECAVWGAGMRECRMYRPIAKPAEAKPENKENP